MRVYLNGKKTQPDWAEGGAGTRMVFGTLAERAAGAKQLGFGTDALESCEAYDAMRYDYAHGFDYLQLDVVDLGDIMAPPRRVELMLSSDRLGVFFDESDFIGRVEDDVADGDERSPVSVLLQLFSQLTWDDTQKLEDMEERISDLEDRMVDEPDGCIGDISSLRRQILVLKRYYEALLDILEDAQENRNNLYTADQLKSISILHNRANRLFAIVQSLRDYVTQARESYQSQMDYNLNQSVKVLTIVTTIFLPLQLLVGWYGMNLIMPEFRWAYGYPIVAVICLVISVACIVYFKRKKWF